MPVDFRDCFWGEGYGGFDTLYRNMKYGYVATRDLADFFKERSLIEENNSKLLAKLAKHASNCCAQGSFAPLWLILKSSSEKLSSLHAQMVQRFQELIKDVLKYSDEQHRKHKQCKEEESGTSDVVQSIQQTTVSMQKAKEAFNARSIECEKLRRENASSKEIEKAEVKCKKACEEYKLYIDKYSNIREEFEKKMTISCQHFQSLEEAHIRQIKVFLSNYANVLESGHALIGQVHVEFQQQCSEMDVDKLLEYFVNTRGTGRERPGAVTFEEADLSSLGQVQSPDSGEAHNEEKTNKKEGFLKSKKRKKKRMNGMKEDTSVTSGEIESQENAKEKNPEIDSEGYTIRPEESNKEYAKEHFYSSSDESEEEEREKKIHVEIKPVSNSSGISASIDELVASIGTISLSPDPQRTVNNRPSSSAASTPDEGPLRRSVSMSNPLNKADGDVFSLFSPSASSASTPTGAPCGGFPSPPSTGNPNATSTPPEVPNSIITKPPVCKEPVLEKKTDIVINEIPKQLPPSREGTPTGAIIPHILPRPPSRRAFETSNRGRMSPLPSYSMPRAESMGSLTNDFKTTSMPVGSSRGPSPLTIGMCDTIPLAVAFSETVNACFRGTDEARCQVRLTGDMKVSFPAGIVQVLAHNPSPAALQFRVSKANKLENILPNKQLISLDTSHCTSEQYAYDFNMPALIALLKKQYEQTPTASYFNIDILKYHIKSLPGAKSTPLHLVAYWKCESRITDLRIDYKFNPSALAITVPINNLNIIVPVNGGVSDVQSKPKVLWNGELNRAVWKIPELNHLSDGGGLGSLRARFDLSCGPSTPIAIAAQFTCNGTSLSGADFELSGSGYRLSLVKKEVIAGKYLCEVAATED